MGYPVYRAELPCEQVESLKEAVAPLMGMPEQEMVGLVPDKTGFRFMGCPDCNEGTQEGQLVWSIEDPHRVVCRFCGMVYPNENYPEDRSLRVVNPRGQEVAYPYWQDESGYRYLFTAKAWREARVYFSDRTKDLGELYQATGDRRYARRGALILDAFARYYPGFLVHRDQPNQPKEFTLQPPYPTHGGKWGRWPYNDMPTDCVYAYDAIHDSGEMERLSGELETDVRARIENDFFLGAIRHDRFYGPVFPRGPLSNASPAINLGYAVIGRVLGDPALVHEAVERSRRLFEKRFFSDGFWCEGSVGYHQMTLRGMQRVFDALRGYSDPPGYTHPDDGTRFDNLVLEEEFPIIERAMRIPEIFRYPDGRFPPVHDSWPRFDGSPAVDRSASTLLAGAGHAWLGRGNGKEGMQVHLHFSGVDGHAHADNLNLILYAKGEELVSDLGYSHTPYRTWSASTLCHNTVLVDGREQYTKRGSETADGRLLAFETAFEPVQWMEASAEGAYPDVANEYRRAVMLISAGGSDAYAVDIFRVGGGLRHDWVIHGCADRDGAAEVDIPLRPYGQNLLPGVSVRFPTYEKGPGDAEGNNLAYAFFQNVSQGEAADDLDLTLALSDSPVGLRTHLAGVSGAEIFLGTAPSLRQAKENNDLIDRFRMPIFLARREGEPPLSSRFVAVHEPYRDRAFLDEALLESPVDSSDAVILSVEHHGATDHIVHRTGPGPAQSHTGDLYLEGEAGFVRERNGAPEVMALWGGTQLRWRDWVLSADGVFEGNVIGVLRSGTGANEHALIVTGGVPEGEDLNGAVAIVVFGNGSTRGCPIRGVKRGPGETHLLLEDDPGFSVAEGVAHHLFHPLYEIPGGVTYRIRTSAFADLRDGQIASAGRARLLRK